MDPDGYSSTSDQPEEEDEQGWEEVEDDAEAVTVVSLFDDKKFKDVKEMLQYCKIEHNFDMWNVRQDLELEFLDLVKLVNYIRLKVKAGDLQPDVSTKSVFEDDAYLKPVLEDDAVLYTIEDALESGSDNQPQSTTAVLQAEVSSLQEQLAQLQSQFSAYRTDVQQTMMQNLNLNDSNPETTTTKPQPTDPSSSALSRSRKVPHLQLDPSAEDGYFSAYTTPYIHRIMLADTIRTDAYRDFIYDNKHLFKDKIVLDVGCGTGILSMFCAKAGAKEVIAVDNSKIIDKARENVFRNGLDGTIRCLHGKIEELVLPVDKVDVIVSEWMGYCLLYESMLDSVLYARDRYLKEDGLMVPSHASLKMAPLVDSEIRTEQIDFWREVYGFDMSSMLEHAFEEAIVQTAKKQEITGDGVVFKQFDLHTATVPDLSFAAAVDMPWQSHSDCNLDGFVVWFDMFFATSRTQPIPNDAPALNQAKLAGAKTLSTGPEGEPTHWSQGILLLKEVVRDVKQGQSIKGEVRFRKSGDGERGLNIEVDWMTDDAKGSQLWKLE